MNDRHPAAEMQIKSLTRELSDIRCHVFGRQTLIFIVVHRSSNRAEVETQDVDPLESSDLDELGLTSWPLALRAEREYNPCVLCEGLLIPNKTIRSPS